jgi:hypothetical protein
MRETMTEATQGEKGKDGQPLAKPTLHRIQFVERAAAGETVVMQFADPVAREAVRASAVMEAPPSDREGPRRNELEIVALPREPKNDPRWRDELQHWIASAATPYAMPPIVVKVRDAQVTWCSGRAVIEGATGQIEPLLAALVDFNYYEAELRGLERELADSWPALEEDAPLAYEVKPANLEGADAVGGRMERTLERRMRHVRIEPHLYGPAAHLPSVAQELGERLRKAARVEDRLEAVDGKLEVFEQVYELASQRINDFRTARKEMALEWIIIVVLIAESLLILGEILWSLEG